jgi:hypothetical protein
MSPLLIARKILEQVKPGLHINDIVKAAAEQELVPNAEIESFQKKLSAALAQNIKTKEPQFKKVVIGGRKKGCYGLHARVIRPTKVPLVPDDLHASKNQFGKAGEYAILSELLFRGFNASIMIVDDGIDVIASKADRFFYIQAKTSKDYGSLFQFTIKKSAFELHHASHTFYILIARRIIAKRHLCDFVIIPSPQINKMIQQGKVRGKGAYSLKLVITESEQFMLNQEDVTDQVNRFNQIV